MQKEYDIEIVRWLLEHNLLHIIKNWVKVRWYLHVKKDPVYIKYFAEPQEKAEVITIITEDTTINVTIVDNHNREE